MSTFAGSVQATIRAKVEGASVLGASPVDELAYSLSQTFGNGTGAEQAAKFWRDSRTLAATSEELDLAGALTDGLGATVTFGTVRTLVIKNKATTAGFDLLIGAAAANQLAGLFGDAASDKLKVRAGGMLIITAPIDGYTVTAGSGDKLKIDAGANSVPYEILIIGT